MSTSTRLIIDTDCGIDDAVALMAALCAPCDVEVAAITCVAGNTTLANVLANVSKVLRVCGREEVPFYAGCSASLAQLKISASSFHGEDGLGNCPPEFPEGPRLRSDVHASLVLIEMAKAAEGEYTLVLLGPCTNLAVADSIDPNVTSYFRQIVCMGGNIQGRGNVTPGGEFNFVADPEAAHVLVSKSTCPVRLVPWETITSNCITWDFYASLMSTPTEKGRFLKAICSYTEPYYKSGESDTPDGYELGDFLAILCAIRPDSVMRSMRRRVAVELNGTYTTGQLVQAWTKSLLPDVTKKTDIALEFDMAVVRETLLAMVR